MSVFIIAEAGINHNGSIKNASKLIVAAKKCGADAIKFQTFVTEENITSYAPKADYQLKNSSAHETQFEMVKKLEFNENDHNFLIKECIKNNIEFMSSPFDIKSIQLIKKFNFDYIKIPSGEINNLPYLKVLAKQKKKLILSTGMSTLSEVKNAIRVLRSKGLKKNNLYVLHCHSDYPSKPENLNLKAIGLLERKIGLNVGYSDHSVGIEAPIIAVAYGAKIIEKHITLNKNYYGPDHRASLEPQEFKTMVDSIRITEKMIGTSLKTPSKIELKNRKLVRKSIVAFKDIKKGEKFSTNNITTKRPAYGKSPMLYDLYLEKKAKKNYFKDDFI